MNLEISPAAWIALICLGGIVLLSFLVLLSAWRRRADPPRPQPMPKERRTPSLTRSWDQEEEKIKELAQAVKDLKESGRSGPGIKKP